MIETSNQNQKSDYLLFFVKFFAGFTLVALGYKLLLDLISYKSQCGSYGYMSGADSCTFFQYFVSGNNWSPTPGLIFIIGLLLFTLILYLIWIAKSTALKMKHNYEQEKNKEN